MKSFVSSKWLHENLGSDNFVVIDCRLDLHDREKGLNDYNEGHIPGAFFLDINTVFSGPKQKHGGSRPLPDLNKFKQDIEVIGISNDTTIVVYDEMTFSSGRAFWMFKYIGHEKVFILNGGISNWIKEEFVLAQEPTVAKTKGHYKISVNDDIYCDIDYIRKHLFDGKVTKIDARAYERFSGDYEPLYDKKGHIPNSINCHSKKVLDENGKLLDKYEINSKLDFLRDKDELILYCGSGVNAALSFAVLSDLNIEAKVYIGSVSDWISYEENDLEMSI